jgi:hypothetical protein
MPGMTYTTMRLAVKPLQQSCPKLDSKDSSDDSSSTTKKTEKKKKP